MAALNLSGKTSGFIKLTAPEVATNSTVELPNKNGILATLDDVGEGGGGGGNVEAQPPVAFKMGTTGAPSQTLLNDTILKIECPNVTVDTDSLINNSTVTIKKAGLYQVNASFTAGNTLDSSLVVAYIKVNGSPVYAGNHQRASQISSVASGVLRLEVNDKLELHGQANGASPTVFQGDAFTSLSGHMISSITEGEVKEKEAVVVMAKPNADQVISKQVWTQVNLDDVESDTTSSLIGGVFKPSVSGYYQVSAMINASGSAIPVQSTLGRILKNGKDALASTNSNMRGGEDDHIASNITGIVYLDGVNDSITLEAYINSSSPKVEKEFTYLNVHLITGQSTGGGSGGGDYTPEKMVWENKISDKESNIVYTNENDVPIYISVVGSSPLGSNSKARRLKLIIDNEVMTQSGREAHVDDHAQEKYSVFGVVPAKSEYKIETTSEMTLTIWQEARMPVAVGTGGKTVAFRGEMSANQTEVTTSTWTKVNLDTASIDTDNAFSDGKFQPSVAGYYQVNGSVQQASSPTSTAIRSSIYKNGILAFDGSYVISDASINSQSSDVIYLNGTTDYIELYGYVISTGTCGFGSANTQTYLSAVLVSGGSASGDSIWTEEDGKAVYDGDIEVNGVTTGQGNNKNVKNTALGINALSKDVGTGAVDAHGSNTAIGDRSMQDLTTGYFNTAIGTASLQKAVDGYNNTALGRSALNYCTSGFDNIGIGREALFGDESRPNTGNSNIGIGTSAIHDCSTGEKNVGIGRSALHFLTSGDENVAIGQGAGNNLETGNNNILIGSGVDTEDVDSQNQTVIGNDRTVKALLRGGLEVKSHLDTVSLTTNANGRVSFPETPSLSTTTQTGNVHMTDTGALYLSTASTYSAEEVDKKLAIKDKLIEKLSARLDELEKRVK